ERLRDCNRKDLFSQIPENPGKKGYLERIYDLPGEPMSAHHVIGQITPASPQQCSTRKDDGTPLRFS
ncbi:unnamed protein product, partial [Pylaiella littoralis]